MKINKDSVSAFAVYSEKFKQKKKTKPIETFGVSTVKKKKEGEHLRLQQMKEISHILKTLAEQSNSTDLNLDLVHNITEANSRIKQKKLNNIKSHGLSVEAKGEESSTTHRVSSHSLNEGKAPKKIKLRNVLQNKMKAQIVNEAVVAPKVTVNPAVNANIKANPKYFQNSEPIQNKSGRVNKAKLNKRKKQLQNTREMQNSISPTFSTSRKAGVGFEAKINRNKESSGVLTVESSNIENRKDKKSSQLKNRKLNKNKSKPHSKKNEINKRRMGESIIKENSMTTGKRLFKWLVQPIPLQDFFSHYWEKQPLLIKRDGYRNYYSQLLSTPAIDAMLRENVIYFNKHLDVTYYADGVRETHNLSGRAQANVVWDFYSNGCSVRLLNPQAFFPEIHALNATLQGYFGCFVGANVYLTPPNSQGFAPHYDDIEAFVLQIEGKKNWKVYHPRSDKETLPRISSPNFSEDDITSEGLIMDVMLEAGDMLYFPRGFIHQASTIEGEHSLHITLSVYQKTAWVDLFEKTLPLALERAAAEDVKFRKGLPRDYLGIEYHGSDAAKVSFMDTAQRLFSRLGDFLSLSLGAGVDLMGAQFMHDALPPVFSQEEKQNSGLGGGLNMRDNGKVVGRVECQLNTCVKLIRANVCRLVEVQDEVRLYHCLDNPLEYHAEEPQFLVLPPESLPAITFLFYKYPVFVEVRNIPHDDKDALLTLVSDLWDAGLLMTRGLQMTNQDDQ